MLKGLNSQQKAILQCHDNYLLVSSCAGSGKTEVICRYALHKEYENIIITTFTNSNKKNILDRFIKLSDKFGIEFPKHRIKIQTIDSLIHQFMIIYYPCFDKTNFSKKAKMFLNWLKENNQLPEGFTSSFYIVDEYQDTYDKPEKAHILIILAQLGQGILAVGDRLQTLMETPESENVFDLFRLTLEPQEFVLNTTIRFGNSIANVINHLTHQEILTMKHSLSVNPTVILHNKLSQQDNAIDLANLIYSNFIKYWLQSGINPSEIAIIQRRTNNHIQNPNYIFSCLETVFKQYNIPMVWYQKEKGSTEAYNLNYSKNKITLCSIVFAKGLEWKKVIFVNCTNWSMPLKNKGVDNLIELSHFNVAITRASDELIITTNSKFASPFLMPLCRKKNKKYNISDKHVEIMNNLVYSNEMIFDSDSKPNVLPTGVVDIVEELNDYTFDEIDNIQFTKKKIKRCRNQNYPQIIIENVLYNIYGIMGELLLARELLLNKENYDKLKSVFFIFIKYYDKSVIIKNTDIDIYFLEKFLKKYRYYVALHDPNRSLLSRCNSLLNFRNQLLHSNEDDMNSDNSYTNWGGKTVFNNVTMLLFTKKTPYIFKEDELLKKKDYDIIIDSIKCYMNSNILTVDLPSDVIFNISCISDINSGRIGILKYPKVNLKGYSDLLNNIKHFKQDVFNVNTISYQKSFNYGNLINGTTDFIITSDNNELEKAKIRLALAKYMYAFDFLAEDFLCHIVDYMNDIYDCSRVIEVKCSGSTQLSTSWKLQLVLYLCMSEYNNGTIVNLMKGIQYQCKLPFYFNKTDFLEKTYDMLRNKYS
jgi:hypothetical protein